MSISRRHILLGSLAGATLTSLKPALASTIGNRSTSLDPTLLGQAVQRAAGLERLHSLIIARHGDIRFAEAFRGPRLNRPANIKSVSKTIVAALTGAALDRGVLFSVDQTVAPFLDDMIPPDADDRVRHISVANLLTMQAGLSGSTYGNWIASDNWISNALGRPFVAEPGAAMQYSTSSYHLLGVMIARAAGQDLLSLARDWLGDPLGIRIRPWVRDPQGFYLGGSEMELSPMALYRFGEMARLHGLWRDQFVLSDGWIEQSWVPRTLSPFYGHEYGYGWFLGETGGRQIAYARGFGGQMLYVVPSLGLTVVVMSDTTLPAREGAYATELTHMLTHEIIPAAERA
ncbi:MAG: serine hydrolase [Pseudomonadota bacterium]